jgi:ribosome-binding protein aMBF1 (putative translation factor)
MTRDQCRAARALVGWSQFDLAARSKVGLSTIRNFETTRSVPVLHSRRAIRQAFEAAGIEFISDGVRRRRCSGTGQVTLG